MSKSFYKWASLIVLFISVIVFSGMFFYQFDGQFSQNQQDWGAFGSYTSGTIGVLAACLAAIWLIRSVSIQQIELNHLKEELKSSFAEQKKQTHINALTALLTSNQQAISNDRALLSAMKNGPEDTFMREELGRAAIIIESDLIVERIKNISHEISFYEEQLGDYLPKVYEKEKSEKK
jgi:hypothetical protein